MMKKLLVILALLLIPAVAAAQIIVDHSTGTITYQKALVGTTISADDMHVEESTAGASAGITIRHSDNTNVASRVELSLITVDGTSGDQSIIFSISNVGDWSLGVDNSDADKFKISTNAALEGATRLAIDRSGNVGFGTPNPDELVHLAGAADGRFTGLLIENTTADAAASLNETAEILFGFAGKNNVARITADKLDDYTTTDKEDSRLGFWVDVDGTLTQIAHFMPDGLMLLLGDSRIRFAGTAGGGGQSIQFKSTAGSNRAALLFPGNNVVALLSRSVDGTVEIRANTSTGGAAGEVTVATFQDDQITFLASGGNMGIGAATAEVMLHVQLGDAGVDPTWNSTVDVAIFESASNDNAAIQIFTANDRVGHIAFSDPEGRSIGFIRYDHALNSMEFFTNGSEGLKISSAGIVLIADLSGGDGSSHVCVDASGNLFNQEAAC